MPSKIDALRTETEEKISDLRKEVDTKLNNVFDLQRKDVDTRHSSDLLIGERLAKQGKDIENMQSWAKQIQGSNDEIAGMAIKQVELINTVNQNWKWLKWAMITLGALILVLLMKGIISVPDLVEGIRGSH